MFVRSQRLNESSHQLSAYGFAVDVALLWALGLRDNARAKPDVAPNPIKTRDEGSGTVPICTVRKSTCAPVPQVQVYVPGVNPMLLKVCPVYVSVAERGDPDR